MLALAERGLLYDEAVDKLAEKRRYWDLNEECWRTDEKAVELHERVVEILQSATGPR